nr:NAD-dependent protein deacylase [Clostridioides difficile]
MNYNICYYYFQKLNKQFTAEQLVSHTFFVRYPEEFFEFYKDKLIYPNAKPNNAHIALAKLEEMGKLKAVITQNIDGLHQMAGSKNVLELHGSVHRNYCTKCGKFFDLESMLNLGGNIPYCDNCGSIVKPDVVLYEEALDSDVITKTISAISNADLLIIGGTSLAVYPAASFIDYYKGDYIALINKANTVYDKSASLVINKPIGEVLYEAVLRQI